GTPGFDPEFRSSWLCTLHRSCLSSARRRIGRFDQHQEVPLHFGNSAPARGHDNRIQLTIQELPRLNHQTNRPLSRLHDLPPMKGVAVKHAAFALVSPNDVFSSGKSAKLKIVAPEPPHTQSAPGKVLHGIITLRTLFPVQDRPEVSVWTHDDVSIAHFTMDDRTVERRFRNVSL